MDVEYREIDGYPGYRVGDDGSIWSHWRTCRWGTFVSTWRRLKTPAKKSKGGYLYLNLTSADKVVTTFRVHRLVLLAFVGPCPEGMEARHLDGDPANNRLENLCWGTQEENRDDVRRHDTYKKGSAHGRSKLTEAQVLEIRRRYANGELQREIAVVVGCNVSSISGIVNRKNWTHI